MNFRWTDTLVEPLASTLRDADWRMVRETRTGAWRALAAGSQVDWYEVEPGSLRLAPLSPLHDGKLPLLAERLDRTLRRGERCRLIAWRVGRRAVLQRDGRDGDTIVKLYRRPRSIGLRWSTLQATAGGEWSTPAIESLDPRRGELVMELCRGTSLNTLWLRGRGRMAETDRLARLLDWIAGTPVPTGLPAHTAEDEAAILEKRLHGYFRTLRRPDPGMPRLVGEAVDALRGLPAKPPVLVHRDLHDKQILFDGDRGRLLDLDLLALGPAELDLGNLLAHLRLRALSGAPLAWSHVARRLVERTAAGRDPQALSVWTAATLTRLALIYARRRRPAGLLERLAGSTRHALGRCGEWAGVFADPGIRLRLVGSFVRGV